jgi:hypothetical protein
MLNCLHGQAWCRLQTEAHWHMQFLRAWQVNWKRLSATYSMGIPVRYRCTCVCCWGARHRCRLGNHMSALYASFVFPTGVFPSQCDVNACGPRRTRQQAGCRAEDYNLAWRRVWIIVRCLRAGHGWLQACYTPNERWISLGVATGFWLCWCRLLAAVCRAVVGQSLRGDLPLKRMQSF